MEDRDFFIEELIQEHKKNSLDKKFDAIKDEFDDKLEEIKKILLQRTASHTSQLEKIISDLTKNFELFKTQMVPTINKIESNITQQKVEILTSVSKQLETQSTQINTAISQQRTEINTVIAQQKIEITNTTNTAIAQQKTEITNTMNTAINASTKHYIKLSAGKPNGKKEAYSWNSQDYIDATYFERKKKDYANDCIKIKLAGQYNVSARAAASSSTATGPFYLQLFKNTSVIAQVPFGNTTTGVVWISCTLDEPFKLQAGDELQIKHTTNQSAVDGTNAWVVTFLHL